MLLNKILQNRNQIIGSGNSSAVFKNHFAGRLSVFSDYNPGGESVTVHIRVVAEIILRHDKGNFSFRQHNVSGLHNGFSCLIGGFAGKIMKTDQNVSFIIHGLEYLFKFVYRSHNLIVAVLI